MSKEIERIGELLENIPDPLPKPDLSYEARLQALHELEDLVWWMVEHEELSPDVGEDVVWQFIAWVEGDY